MANRSVLSVRLSNAGQVTRVANNNILGASSGKQGGVLYNGPSASDCASGSGAVASISQFLLNTMEIFRSGECAYTLCVFSGNPLQMYPVT
jgi:hypothetical protein